MFTKQFWQATLERAIKTAAQVAILAILAGATILGDGSGFDILSVDWMNVLSFAVGGAILSVLTSIASAAVSEKGTPSLTGAETTVREDDIPWDDIPVETHENHELQ